MDARLQAVSLSEIGTTVGSPPSSRFAASVRRMGVIQPVLLAETTADSGEIEYVIVDGNRRIHAARRAKLREIPAVVITGIEAEERVQLTLIANGFRSPNYLTEFWAIKALERSGFSLDDVMKIGGMSESVVSTRRRLSHLQRDIFIGLRNGKVSQTNAITIAKMDRQDQDGLASIYSRTGKLLKRDVDLCLAAINKRSTSHLVAPDTSDPPQSVTTAIAIEFAQAASEFKPASSIDNFDSTTGVHSTPEAELYSDPSIPTPYSRDQKSQHSFTERFSTNNISPTLIQSQAVAPSQASTIANPREQRDPVEEVAQVLPTPASRAVMHMRSAAMAAHLLDFSRDDFLDLAARVWDDSLSKHQAIYDQSRDEQVMRDHAPTEPFPDLAAHKWDTGES